MFYDFTKKESVKRKANKMEKKFAKKHGLYKTPCSGAISGHKGDCKSLNYLFDIKSTDADSIRLKVKDLSKAMHEADGAGKQMVLVIRFNKYDKEYAVIPMEVFNEFKEISESGR